MYLEQLRSFCAVVDQGSYTRAGRELDLSQPAVSQHVHCLERAFSLSLVDRVDGRMQPTEAGEVVYRHSIEILAHADALRDALDAMKGLSGGRVVVGAGVGVGNYVLPRIVARFRHRHPDVRVELRVDDAPKIFAELSHGLADFAVLLGYEVPSELITVPLYQDPIVLVVAPNHPIIKRWPHGMPRAAIAEVPLVARSGRESTARRLSDQWLREAGIEPKIDMEFHSHESIKRVVADGIGAAFFHLSNVAMEVAAGLLKVVDLVGPPLFNQFVLARRPRQHISPAALAFLRALHTGLQGDPFVRELNLEAVEQFMSRGGSVAPTSGGRPRGTAAAVPPAAL